MLKRTLLSVLFSALAFVSPFDAAAQSRREFEQQRLQMVDEEIIAAGVENAAVLDAMRTTPRHEFVAIKYRKHAYLDMALPIGESQTISPPFVVAYMTEQLDPQPGDRVLEIGTGSGYQAAVLSPLVKDVYTIEIVDSLGSKAKRTLARLGYDNVHVQVGDGYKGWPSAAPFDKIIVTCSPEDVPKPLVEQLREGGRMIVPVGERYSQNLYLFTKTNGELVREALRATLFVPMTGAAESEREIHPDPLNPEIANGSFESLAGQEKTPANWHYLRQVQVVQDDPLAPDGSNFVTFANKERGRGCRALQGFAIDGREIAHLDVSFWIKGNNIRVGQNRRQWPFVVITYYGERREPLHDELVGPFSGTFDWRRETARTRVPLAAREAIIRIGLLGAVGEISFDAIEIRAIDPSERGK